MSFPAQPFTADRTSSVPVHRQIERWLRTQIESGALPPGSALPPREKFCEILGGVNHLTIRKAVDVLTKEGLIFSVQGRGTFVSERKQKQLRVGLVLPNFTDEFTSSIADGAQQYFEDCRGEGMPAVQTVFFDCRRDVQKEIDNVKQLEDLPLDGAIVLPVNYGSLGEQLFRLKLDGFPLVLIGRVPGLEFNSVVCDDYAGTYAATKYLLEQCGRKNVAWLGNRKAMGASVARFEGYRDALNDFGFAYSRKLTGDYVPSTPTSPYEAHCLAALDSLLAGDLRPDGIVCSNDLEALLCLQELKRRSIKVPQEIAVVGFDDMRDTAHSHPPLTTIHTPMRDLGREAAKLMLKTIENPSHPLETFTVPFSLVVREST